MSRFTPEEKVKLARNPARPGTADFIGALFTGFFEQRGDRLCGEDASILGGIARFHGRPVTVIGHRKGKNLEENLRCNFGMPSPEGYRKAGPSSPLWTLRGPTPERRRRSGARGRPLPSAWP